MFMLIIFVHDKYQLSNIKIIFNIVTPIKNTIELGTSAFLTSVKKSTEGYKFEISIRTVEKDKFRKHAEYIVLVIKNA